MWRCKVARDPVCAPCPAGTWRQHPWLEKCTQECPQGSTSQVGSRSQRDCRCKRDEGFSGPDGGPCERTREGVVSFAEGTTWVFGSDNFSSAALRLNLSVAPWPHSLMDDALRHHLKAWPWDAARFWAQQGDVTEAFPWSLRDVLYRVWWAVRPWEQSYVDAFAQDASGLGAWIGPLRDVAAQDPSVLTDDRKRYARVAAAIEDWRLLDVAQTLADRDAREGGQDAEWPAVAEVHDVVVYPDGVVEGPVSIEGVDVATSTAFPAVCRNQSRAGRKASLRCAHAHRDQRQLEKIWGTRSSQVHGQLDKVWGGAALPARHAKEGPALKRRQETRRFVLKGCAVASEAYLDLLQSRFEETLCYYASVPHYARVVSIANHFGGAYYHFVIESLVRLTPFLPELRANARSTNPSDKARLVVHVSSSHRDGYSNNMLRCEKGAIKMRSRRYDDATEMEERGDSGSVSGIVGGFLELLGVPLESVTSGVITARRLLIPSPGIHFLCLQKRSLLCLRALASQCTLYRARVCACLYAYAHNNVCRCRACVCVCA